MALKHTSGFWPVISAVAGNATVTAAKFVAAFVSGSSAMFSEAIHSTADTLNQILLLIGLQRSIKKAGGDFAYGYGNERFFWALISACGVFFVGAGVTAYHGVNSLLNPKPIEYGAIIFAVLLFAFIIEFYTFLIAARSLKNAHPGSTLLTRLREADPMTLAVYLEDAIAVAGVAVAAAAIGAAYYTGDTRWDAIGSLVISAFLAVAALILIVKNRAYLLGRALPEEAEKAVIKLLETEASIEKVLDFKSTGLGWNVYRIKCEVEFNGAALLAEENQQSALRDDFNKSRDFESFKKFNVDFADRIPRLIGRKIDEIEKRIKTAFPQIRHIDIEIN